MKHGSNEIISNNKKRITGKNTLSITVKNESHPAKGLPVGHTTIVGHFFVKPIDEHDLQRN